MIIKKFWLKKGKGVYGSGNTQLTLDDLMPHNEPLETKLDDIVEDYITKGIVFKNLGIFADQFIQGGISLSNSGDTGNSINVTAENTTQTSSGIYVLNRSTTSSSSNVAGVEIETDNVNSALILRSDKNNTSATGNLLQIVDSRSGFAGDIKLFITKEGNITAQAFIKENGNSDQILLADGSVTSLSAIGGGGIQSIVEGTNITINNSDPDNPVISSTGSAGNPLTSVTISELRTLISTSNLVAGAYYLITDFKHIYNLVDHAISSTSDSSLDTNIEPLVLQALTSNTVSESVESTLYPSDTIRYDINDTSDGHTNGRIYYRHITEKNIKADYDIRNEKFRLYQIDVPEYVLANEASYVRGDIVKDTANDKYYLNVVDPSFTYDGATDLTNRKRWADITDYFRFMLESPDSIGKNTSIYNLTADTANDFVDELGYDVSGKGNISLTRGIVIGSGASSSIRSFTVNSSASTPFTLKVRSITNSNIIVRNNCALNGVSGYNGMFSNCVIPNVLGVAENSENIPEPLALFDGSAFSSQLGSSIQESVVKELYLNDKGAFDIKGNRGIDNRESSHRITNVIISNPSNLSSILVVDCKARNLKFLNAQLGELRGTGEILDCVFQTDIGAYATSSGLSGFSFRVNDYLRNVNFIPDDDTAITGFGRMTIDVAMDISRNFKLKNGFVYRSIRQFGSNATDILPYYYTIDGSGNESPVLYS